MFGNRGVFNPVSTRERRHERTRQDILNTAIAIIREKGADSLSLREVARRIDYSPAGLYEYFGSKDDLVDAICGEADNRLRRHLESVPQDLSPGERLIRIGMAYVAFARENPEHYTFLFNNQQLEATPGELIDQRQEDPPGTFFIALNAVEAAVEAGVVNPRGQDSVTLTYQLWAIMHGMAALQVSYLQRFPLDFETADRAGIEALVRGME